MPVPRILANSIPKAGSSLLWRCLKLLPVVRGRGRVLMWYHDARRIGHKLAEADPGVFVTAHLHHSETIVERLRGLKFRTLLMVRDPRDIIVSFIHYARRFPESAASVFLSRLPSEPARIEAVIRGMRGDWKGMRGKPGTLDIAFAGLGETLRRFAPWREEPFNLTLRFEDLVGSSGGGCDDAQRRALQELARHLGIELSADEEDRCARRLFDPTGPMFRRGQVGEWRDQFTPRLHRLYETEAGA